MKRYHYNIGLKFLEVVENHGGKTALLYADGSQTTYSDLRSMALSIGQSVVLKEVDKPVALIHDKSPEMYATMLALLLVGVPYACIDPENPSGRIQSIIETLSLKHIVGPHDLLKQIGEKLPEDVNVQLVSISELTTEKALDPNRVGGVTGDSVAYVMFTSGSTGVPKGVAISHSNLVNFADWAGDSLGVDSSTTMTNVNPMYFDNSVFDFFACLMNGGTLLPITQGLLSDFRKLTDFITVARPDFWFSVPSTLIYLNTMKVLDTDFLSSFKTIMFGGEGYPRSELRKLRVKLNRSCRLVNVYGPTECTCICSSRELRDKDLEGDGLPPLGSMIPNFHYKVVAQDGTECPRGEVGELHLFGPNVGLGYYADPELTKSCFGSIVDSGVARRFYRTGDMVVVDQDSGDLHFKGRIDNQIKHMGYRIELEEIELALTSFSGVEQAAVIYVRESSEAGVIYAFLAGSVGEESEGLVRAHTAALLPAYMLPRKYVFLRHLKKNANGKIDKKHFAEIAKSDST